MKLEVRKVRAAAVAANLAAQAAVTARELLAEDPSAWSQASCAARLAMRCAAKTSALVSASSGPSASAALSQAFWAARQSQ